MHAVQPRGAHTPPAALNLSFSSTPFRHVLQPGPLALEGLFSELLDITKIDTGGVDIQPEHFAMRDMFNRIQMDVGDTAQ